MSDNRLYNEELKNRYLSNFENEQTRTTISYILYKAAPIEEVLKKDLHEMSLEDISSVLKNTDPMNKNVATTNGRIISGYITWAKENGYSSNINPMQRADSSFYESLVYNKKLYISEDELNEITSKLHNPQDQVIIQLIFEGVNGYQSSELLNLQKQDVNFDTGELQLTDDRAGQRAIKVSDRALAIIDKALSQTEYYLKNGESQRNPSPLVSNDYVVKTVARRSENLGKADRHAVYRKITMISEIFDLPYLTAKNIEKSGMIKMAKDLYVRDGELEKDQLWEIADHFAVSKMKMPTYETYNTTLLREFISMDNIRQMYNVE